MKTMIIKRTGRTTSTSSFANEVKYLGTTSSKPHINSNGILKRDLLVGSRGVRTNSLKNIYSDYSNLFKRRPDLKVLTYQFVVSPSKGTINVHNKQNLHDFMTFNLQLDKALYPNHLAVDYLQADNKAGIPHCHHLISSMSVIPPHKVLRGNDYGTYHVSYVANKLRKKFNNSRRYSITLGVPTKIIYHRMNNRLTPSMKSFLISSAPIIDRVNHNQLSTHDFINQMRDKCGVDIHIASIRRRMRDSNGKVVYLRNNGHYVYHKNNHGHNVKVAKYYNQPRISYLPLNSSRKSRGHHKVNSYFTPRTLAKVNPAFKNNNVVNHLRAVDIAKSKHEYKNPAIGDLSIKYYYRLDHDEQNYTKSLLALGAINGHLDNFDKPNISKYLKKTGKYLNSDQRNQIIHSIKDNLNGRDDYTTMGRSINVNLQKLAQEGLQVHNIYTFANHGINLYNHLSTSSQRYFADNLRGTRFGNKNLLFVKQNSKHNINSKYLQYLKKRLDYDVRNIKKNREGKIIRRGTPISSTEKNKVDKFFRSNYLRTPKHVRFLTRKLYHSIKQSRIQHRVAVKKQIHDYQQKGLKIYKLLSNAGKRYYRNNLSACKFGNTNLLHIKSTPINKLSGFNKVVKTNLTNDLKNQFTNKKGQTIKMGDPVNKTEKHLVDNYFAGKVLQSNKNIPALKQLIKHQLQVDIENRILKRKQQLSDAVTYAENTFSSLDKPGWKYFKANLNMSKYGANYLNHVKFTPIFKLSPREQHTKSYLHSVATGTFTTKDAKTIHTGREVNDVEKHRVDNIFRFTALQTKNGMSAFRSPIVNELKHRKAVKQQFAQAHSYKSNATSVYHDRLLTGSMLYSSLSSTGKMYLGAKIRLGEKDLGWLDKVENGQATTPDIKSQQVQLRDIAQGYNFDQLKLDPSVREQQKPAGKKLGHKEKRIIELYLHSQAVRQAMTNKDLMKFIKNHKTKKPFKPMNKNDFQHIHAYKFGARIAEFLNHRDERKLACHIKQNFKRDANFTASQPSSNPKHSSNNQVKNVNIKNIMDNLSNDTARRALYVRSNQVIPELWNNHQYGKQLSKVNLKYGNLNRNDKKLFQQYDKYFNHRLIQNSVKVMSTKVGKKTRTMQDELRLSASKLNPHDTAVMKNYLDRRHLDYARTRGFNGQFNRSKLTQSNMIDSTGNPYSFNTSKRLQWSNAVNHDYVISAKSDFHDNTIKVPNLGAIKTRVTHLKTQRMIKKISDKAGKRYAKTLVDEQKRKHHQKVQQQNVRKHHPGMS